MASNKVSLLQYQSRMFQWKSHKKRIIIISFSFIILISLIRATRISSHTENYTYNQGAAEPTESTKPNSPNLKTLCSVTQDPELCISSISSAIKETETDPDDICAVCIKVAIHNITSLAPFMREVLLSSNRSYAASSLKYCSDLFTDSLSQLNRTLAAVELAREMGQRIFTPVDWVGGALTSDRREELGTWLTGSMSGFDICGDILDEVGSMAVNDLSVKVYKARVQVSNCQNFLLFKDAIMPRLVFNQLIKLIKG